jgi:hypothetical protein
MRTIAFAAGLSLIVGCGSAESPRTDVESPMNDSASSQTIQLAGDRTIHLPSNRTLAPLEVGSVIIDLAVSQICGLIIHEPEDNVVRVLGPPDVDAATDLVPHDRKYFYSSHGMCVNLLYGNIHAFHFWLTPEAAKRALAFDADPSAILDHIAQEFTPCNAKIVGRNYATLQLSAGLSRKHIESTLGAPDKVTDWPDGGTSLTYFGHVREGDYDRLHLDFSINAGELQSVYLTH